MKGQSHTSQREFGRSFLMRFLAFRVRQPPVPLVDARRRTVVSWSAKSACTHVLIWYLQRMGLLEAAQSHHAWLHRYRIQVLYPSLADRLSRTMLSMQGARSWTYVKVVRDPVARCVSSYRHALRYGYADAQMSSVLERAIDHRQGFSYETFLEYLSAIDLARCNIHHRLQAHPMDDPGYGRIFFINADETDLDDALTKVDQYQQVAPGNTAGSRTDAIAKAARRHARDVGRTDVEGDPWKVALNYRDTAKWPGAQLRKAEPAATRVYELYAGDYEMIRRLSARAEVL
ncbi:MAG: sulfotransferase family 2 domain-containing protein [Xanthomonadales bacterium]|nr:sulfotransferase family 2 domain-containing protein [Xanthomonadales bacterium]